MTAQDMEVTGERLVPDRQQEDDLYHEHVVRYMFAAQLAGNRDILDAGCGAGYGARMLAQAGARSVLGIDIAQEAVAYARQRYTHPSLRFAVADLTALDLPPTSLDLVVAFEVIEHLEQPDVLVGTAARLLRENGLFVVSTPNVATYPPGNPFHKRELSLDEFTHVLRSHFGEVAMFAEDYTAALALRPLMAGETLPSSLVEAGGWRERAPDYYVALCAKSTEVLRAALQRVAGLVYELPADRLGQRMQEVLTLNRLLQERDELLRKKDDHIVALESAFQQQAVWARDLERQLTALQSCWYVRLFGRRWR